MSHEQVDELVWAQVGAQAWGQVRAQIRERVWGQVGEQAWEQVRAQVQKKLEDSI